MSKTSFLVGTVVGYVLGSRAGRGRYEEIVAIARRVAGSQTIQATAGVLQAQATEIAERTRHRISGDSSAPTVTQIASNGHHHIRH